MITTDKVIEIFCIAEPYIRLRQEQFLLWLQG